MIRMECGNFRQKTKVFPNGVFSIKGMGFVNRGANIIEAKSPGSARDSGAESWIADRIGSRERFKQRTVATHVFDHRNLQEQDQF